MPGLPISENVSVSVDETATGDDAAKKQVELERKKTLTDILTSIVLGIAVTTIALEILSIVALDADDGDEKKGIVYATAITGIILAPTVIMKQYILQRLDTLRCVHNKIRTEVNRLTAENNKLHTHINDLEIVVDKVQGIENQLSEHVQDSVENIDRLLEAVEENKAILKKQGELARAAFQEELLTTVLRTDRNQDLKITDREVDILIMRIRGKEGIRLNEEKFRKDILKNNGSVWGIMALLKDVGGNISEDKSNSEGGNIVQNSIKSSLVEVDEKALIKSQKGLVMVKQNSTIIGFEAQLT
eukprot:CAMPEP_0194098624 /NCGR_PEP_ID=MMETSP0149-20130528/58474_1 /TAXON_ID=122233 /ORGANISM="Chaetoceros debilis, Strain MM31A-1" /LENGTH=301 /DNA_ID=CAMNT_0038784679 /DNA_START=29 /DNA_END=934 /DNA_ORIENTATION=-